MPYIAIKSYPKDFETKQKLVDKINQDVIDICALPAEAVTISYEEIEKENWPEQVVQGIVAPNMDKMWIVNGEKKYEGSAPANETLTVLETRRSCRNFKPELIEEEKLEAIIKAGTFAATGMGKQSPIIIAVTNKEMRDKLCKMNAQVLGNPDMDPYYGAPELLIVLASKEIPTHVYDGSLVMGNLMNAAAAVGVSSCWIHRAKEVFESEEGKAILKGLGIEGEYVGIGHLVLGYAAEPAKEAAPRKENYVYYIK